MIPLKAIFKFNKLLYTLLKRNEYVALYGIGGTADIEAERFEVFKILIHSDESGVIELVPSNSDIQLRESQLKCFNDFKSALKYFNRLAARIKLYHRILKVITGVEENVEAVPE
jgi:hypothetical protein